MKSRSKLLGVGLGGAVMVGAGPAARMVGPTGEPQAVDASMFVAGGPELSGIDIQSTIPASAAKTFEAFTTSGGWKRFVGAEAAIELRIGGPFEVYFDPEQKIGSNGCQVLSYVPGEMVSFSWNAPPQFAAERAKRTWVVVTFADAGEGQTRVRLRHLGFGGDGKWPEVKTYFENAWPRVLGALSASFAKK